MGSWARSDEFAGLARLQSLAACPVNRRRLDSVHLRVFAPENYVEVWNGVFGWEDGTPASATDTGVHALAAALHSAGGNRQRLAVALEADPSFVGKVLKGRKPCPAGLAHKAREFLAGPRGTEAVAVPASAESFVPGSSSLEIAREYLGRGWGIVPQAAGAKKPRVKWKVYQERLPRGDELAHWYGRWPEDGFALVLGPVSDVFVIDVDGEEAHRALLDRLGVEPGGPKALSGSSRPFRYHLFFRHPAVATRAKATPWHPQLEFRGKGGVVILPPSVHKSGRRYAWAAGRSPAEVSLGDVPPAVLAALAPAARKAGPRPLRPEARLIGR